MLETRPGGVTPSGPAPHRWPGRRRDARARRCHAGAGGRRPDHGRLDALLDAVAVFAVRRHPVGRFQGAFLVHANPVWLAWFAPERSLASLQGQSLYEAVPEMEARRALHERVVETGEPFRGTVEVVGPAGPRIIDLFLSAYGDGLISSSRDVTAEQEARRALIASEEQLRRMLEGIDAIVTYRVSRAQPIPVSLELERILGYHAGQPVDPESWGRSSIPITVHAAMPCCRARPRSGTSSTGCAGRRGRGLVLDRARNTLGPDGRPDALFSVVVDVTERYEPRERLAEACALSPRRGDSSDVVFRGSPAGTVEWVSPSGTGARRLVAGGDGRAGSSASSFAPRIRPRLAAAQRRMAMARRALLAAGPGVSRPAPLPGGQARPARDDSAPIVAGVGSCATSRPRSRRASRSSAL